ncbi:MAG TPA: hypothetical protein VII19_00735 [Acidimicrobiales bacterium]|jgi:predicted amidohydrolase YtcJ
MAMAAKSTSVDVGGGAASGPGDLRRLLRESDSRLAPGAWLRAVGYDGTSGDRLDRWVLDDMVPDRPVRVQHRSGHQWLLNSAAVQSSGSGATGPRA